jgi:hypothetical protein
MGLASAAILGLTALGLVFMAATLVSNARRVLELQENDTDRSANGSVWPPA